GIPDHSDTQRTLSSLSESSLNIL
ncbi:hypothetical protein CCACVL1_23633, partial [Corchorus capsularis]